MKKSSFAFLSIGILVSLLLFSVVFPPYAVTEEIQYGELNEKGLERELQYGDSIKDQSKWKEFSQSVKEKQKAAWEYESEKFMMKKLGLSRAEAESNLMTNTAYLSAKAKWEQDAASLIEKKFGTWKAKEDWNYNLDAGQLRNKIVDWVWSDKGNVSNVLDNVVDMKERVLSKWQDYADLYNTGLMNFLDNLKNGTDGLSQEARDNYLSAINATAEAHREALTGIGGNFIHLEEQQYMKYMGRISWYQTMTSNSQYNFSESNSTSTMDGEVSNVNSTASNMQDPMTIAKGEIAKIQTNVYNISENLNVPDTPEEDLTVGIKNWDEMVRNQYQAGLQQWEDARLSLLAKMADWQKNAQDGYTNGLADWNAASDELARQREDWEVKMQQNIASNVSVWNSKIDDGQTELSNSLSTLMDEIGRANQDYDEYSAGMMQVFVEGSSTLKTIDGNLDWLAQKMQSNQTERAPYWNILSAPLSRLNGVKDFYQNTTITRSEASGYAYNYDGSIEYQIDPNTESWALDENYERIPVIAYSDVPYTVKQFDVNYSGSASDIEFRTSGVYIHGNFSEGSVTQAFGDHDTTNYVRTFAASGGSSITLSCLDAFDSSHYQKDANGILFTFQFVNMNDIQTVGKYKPIVDAIDADYASFNNEKTRWTTLKSNYLDLVHSSQNKLQEELFSTDLGKGILSNSPGVDGVDLYLRSEKEMDYAQKAEQLKYYQEKMEIAKAVADYALSHQNESYDGIQDRVSNLAGIWSNTLDQYNAALSNFNSASDAVSNASAGLMTESSALVAAKQRIDTAMAAYESARKEYEKQQSVLAVLEEGGDTIRTQSATFINKAISDYEVSLTLYNKARDQYYDYYTEKADEQAVKLYYDRLTNTQIKLDKSTAGAQTYLGLANEENLASLTGNVDSASAELLLNAQNSGIENGLRGRMQTTLSISNSYQAFYTALQHYLINGDGSVLAEYTNKEASVGAAEQRKSYIDLTMNAASDFITQLKLKQNNGHSLVLKSEFLDWETSFYSLSAFSSYSGDLKEQILQGVWNYVSSGSFTGLQEWLSGNGQVGYDPQHVIDTSMTDWNLMKNYLGGGDREMLEQYLRANVNNVDQLSLSEYESKINLLQTGGEFAGLISYYNKYMGDLRQAKDSTAGEFAYYAGEALQWGKTFFSMQSGSVFPTDVTSVNSIGSLTAAVNALTNQVGKYGDSVDAYIHEMQTKLAAAEMLKNNTYASATNNMQNMMNDVDGKLAQISAITNAMDRNNNFESLGAIDKLYQLSENESSKSGLRDVAAYEIIKQINLNGIYPTQDAAESEILAQVGVIYGSATRIAGLTKEEMKEKIKDEVLKQAVISWISSAVSAGGTGGAAESLLGGYTGRYQELGGKYETALLYMSGEDISNDTTDEINRLCAIQEAYVKGSADTSLTGTQYYKLLASLYDYRLYRTLGTDDKNLLDTGNVAFDTNGAVTYLLSQYESIGLDVSYSKYGSLLNTLMQELSVKEAALMDEAQNLASQANGLKEVTGAYQAFLQDNVLRDDVGLLAKSGDVTTNIVVNNDIVFDKVVSNILYVRKDKGYEGYTEVYRMLDGLASFASNYTATRSGFLQLRDTATNAVNIGAEAAGWKPENLGYDANSLLSKNMQQYQAQYAGWNDAADKLSLWTTAYQQAGNSSSSYLQTAGYIQAATDFSVQSSNVMQVQNGYYSNLSVYNTALSNYYDKLDIEGTKKTDLKAKEVEERKAFGIYRYAMLPLLVGTEENSWNTAMATNQIRPLQEYSNYLTLFTSNQTELNKLGAAIQTERQLVGAISAELNQYKNDYKNYTTLVDAKEILGEKEGIVYKQMMESKEIYETQARDTFGSAWDNTEGDPVYSAMVQQFAKGQLSADSINNLLQATIGQKTDMSYDTLVSLLSQYQGTANENLYRMLFGVRTKTDISNAVYAEVADMNAKIQKYVGYVITNRTITEEISYDQTGMKETTNEITNETYTPLNIHTINWGSYGNNIAGVNMISEIAAMTNTLRGIAYQGEIESMQAVVSKLTPFEGYYSFDRRQAYGCLWTFAAFTPSYNSGYKILFDGVNNENKRDTGDFGSMIKEYANYNDANSWQEMINNMRAQWNTVSKDTWSWLPKPKIGWTHVVVWKGVIEFDLPYPWLDFNDPVWLWNNLVKATIAPTSNGDLTVPFGMQGTASEEIVNLNGNWTIKGGSASEYWGNPTIMKRWGTAGEVSQSGESAKGAQYGRDLTGMRSSIGKLQTDWADYNSKTNMAGKYSMDVGNYTNASGKIDASKLNDTFFNALTANINTITSGKDNIAGLKNIYNAEKDFLAGYLNGPSIIQNGKVSMSTLLDAFQEGIEKYLSSSEDKMRADMHTSDNADGIYLDKVITTLMSPNIYGSADISSEAFRTIIKKVGSLKSEAYKTSKMEEEQLQANKWQLQQDDLTARKNQETSDMVAIYNTGKYYWDRAQTLFADAQNKWDSNYVQGYQQGLDLWTSKTNTLDNRKEEWLNISINVVSGGSANFINDQFSDSLYNRTMQLINDDLPVDVSKSIQAKAKELEGKLAPKNSDQYMGFFNTMIDQSKYADVKFVMDGISRFGGDGGLSQEFNSQMQEFKKEQVKLAAIKMKDDFREQMKDMIESMNKNMDKQNYNTKNFSFAPMVASQGYNLEGNQWTKRDVVLNSTAGGDVKRDFIFAAYHDYTNRLLVNDYMDDSMLNSINGHQAKFDILMKMQQDKAQNNFKALMDDFGKHVGTESYSSSSAPARYDGSDGGKGELYRLTWATSYYGYLESTGLTRKYKGWWDKPLWDNMDQNDPTKLGFGLSFFDVNRIVASVVMTCTGVGALAAAAINVGIALTHDVLNLGTGNMTGAQFGVSVLTDTITGVAAMATAGLGDAASVAMKAGDALGSMGYSLASSGVNSLANVATSGLHVNSSGQMDWSLSKDQWGSLALGSVASAAAVGLNQGLGIGKAVGGWSQNIAGGSQSWFGNAVGYGMQKATESFVSSGLSTLASSYNLSDGSWKPYDWSKVATATAVAGAGGFISGGVAAGLGGVYDSKDGKMNFWDPNATTAKGDQIGLFYGDKLNQFANTIGTIGGQGVSYLMGGGFNMSLGGVGMTIGSNGVMRNDGAGGVDLMDVFQSAGNLNYVGFQAKNHGSLEGKSIISYANIGYLSGNALAGGTAMDLINGKKNITFDLDESKGDFGYSGEDNKTIHLAKQAVINGVDPEARQKLALYTSTMAREGYLLNTHQQIDSKIANLDNPTKEFVNQKMEENATIEQLGVMDDLRKNLGLSVDGVARYEALTGMLAYSAMAGNQGVLDYSSGRSLKVAFQGYYREYFNQNYNKSTGAPGEKDGKGNSREGKKIGGVMCNVTTLASLLSDMGGDLTSIYMNKTGMPNAMPVGSTDPDILEEFRRVQGYGARTDFSTLAKIATDSGLLAPVNGDGNYAGKGTPDERKYGLNALQGEMGQYDGRSSDYVRKKYLAMRDYLQDGDQIVLGIHSDTIKIGGGTYTDFGHVIGLLTIQDNGIWVKDPYGTLNPDKAEYARKNSSEKEFDNAGIYFLSWNDVNKYKVGGYYIYLKMSDEQRANYTPVPAYCLPPRQQETIKADWLLPAQRQMLKEQKQTEQFWKDYMDSLKKNGGY